MPSTLAPSSHLLSVFPQRQPAVEFDVNLDLDFRPDPLEERRRRASIPDVDFRTSEANGPVSMSKAVLQPTGVDRGLNLLNSRIEYDFTA